jgi:NADH-quinone oxidoreductase subunit C
MSRRVLDRLRAEFGERILETTEFRGDEVAIVAPADWVEIATFVKRDPECMMNHFTDITAADFPEREPEVARFDVVVCVRSMLHRHRVRLKTRVGDGEELATLGGVWAGAAWGEREIYDMFGIRFAGHQDLRRILLYEEFVGYPLRKDYPIDRTQPLVPYRDDGLVGSKLPPFGQDEGQPWTRINWVARLNGEDQQVSPAIALQQGQRKALSESSAHETGAEIEE